MSIQRGISASGGSRLAHVFAAIDEGFCICEIVTDDKGRPADYRFLEVNERFEEFSGLKDPVGRTALELVPDLEPHWISAFGRVGLGRETLRFEECSERLDRWFHVFATPVEPHGCFAIVFRDITRDKQIERERESALARSQQLLKELNHRVMNSLGMIAAIISVESGALESEDGKAALQRLRARIEALGSLYRLLTSSSAVETVDARNYLSAVVSGVAGTLAVERNVRIETDIAPVTLELPVAVPLALIANELVTNSLKYAFEGIDEPRIAVTLKTCGSMGHLVLRDNGNGFDGSHVGAGTGVGNRLIDAFALQLEGRLERRSDADGTTVTLDFPIRRKLEVPAA